MSSCSVSSGSVIIGAHEQSSRILSIQNQNEQGKWNVTLPPGSTLIVRVRIFYSASYPDAWYIEITDENGRITRSVSFPNTNNAPLRGVIPSGNATVLIKYSTATGVFPPRPLSVSRALTPHHNQFPKRRYSIIHHCYLFCFLGNTYCNHPCNGLASPSEKQKNEQDSKIRKIG